MFALSSGLAFGCFSYSCRSARIPILQVKIAILQDFHKTALVNTAWKLEGVGDGDERKLLENFFSVTAVFQSLPAASQEVGTEVGDYYQGT